LGVFINPNLVMYSVYCILYTSKQLEVKVWMELQCMCIAQFSKTSSVEEKKLMARVKGRFFKNRSEKRYKKGVVYWQIKRCDAWFYMDFARAYTNVSFNSVAPTGLFMASNIPITRQFDCQTYVCRAKWSGGGVRQTAPLSHSL